MRHVLCCVLLGGVLMMSIGCEDQVTTIQQKDEVHKTPPEPVVVGGVTPGAQNMPPEPELPPAGRFLPPFPAGVSAQQALMAKRAAELDAYRKLGEQIRGLRVDSRTYVKDFVTESDVITTDLQAYLRGVVFTRYQFISDGIVEAEAAVKLSQIVTYLRELRTRKYQGDKVKALDYNTMRQVNNISIVTTTGQGAVKGR